MSFGFKTLIAAGIMAAGLGTTGASAMPMASGISASQADVVVHADKTAIVCIGRCNRRFGYGRPGYRAFAYRGYGYGYRPYALYRPHRFGYYR